MKALIFVCWLTLMISGLGWAIACDVDDDDDDESGSDDDNDAADDDEAQCEAPVSLADRAHRPIEINDFVRLIFLSPDSEPSGMLSLPAAVRAFVGPAPYYEPPLPLKDLPQFSGLSYWSEGTLLAIRCTPADAAALDPVLATWPNVFALIKEDLGATYSCPPDGYSPENDLYCQIKDFADEEDSVAVNSVYRALSLATTLFEDEDRATVLKNRYGIYPEFSGLGYSVKTYGDYDPMTAAVVLENSVVPEYLVKNVALAAGGCKCIRVPAYTGRENDVLDLDLIAQQGTADCALVERLAAVK